MCMDFNTFYHFALFSFRTTNIEGSVTMNGHERNISAFRKLSAYIMQDNQLHGNLTVQEAMTVATNLKLSKKFTKTEKMSMVSDSETKVTIIKQKFFPKTDIQAQ